VTEELFDLSSEYESMLNQGIRISGESMAFFLEGRLALLRDRLYGDQTASRILDFGCGLGYTSKRLGELFPSAEIVGADTSLKALEAAQEQHGSQRIRFVPVSELGGGTRDFDLCYMNGVFHHIAPADRPQTVRLIHDNLRSKGRFALFENNPWNPGARIVMARIPFDRDAQMLSLIETSSLLKRAGFEIEARDSLFFFPNFLKAFRFAEPLLSWTRLGAQYLVLAAKR
jgi:SAM-dependent methyltransferase